ncbi:hypothetical protein PAI11_14550 [Patulibacter medicamentivorans]|uniref:Uncharacterized protein n=1 Tax=Patulibacter medicamentivorans TaxID=1097667 RepID=H0E3T1_9ACTN|nr:hypothetical protein [Patulibacter medicamentivorans]EHN11650.1 hypothetical protein PAI11_14550 [Patulibacter medicamentivorans]
MTTPTPIVLVLELDPEVEPITGRVRTAAGRDLPFRGWAALASVLGAMTGPVPPPTPPQEHHDATHP